MVVGVSRAEELLEIMPGIGAQTTVFRAKKDTV